ncbi:peptidoglycan-binding domain-containing protein [Pseudochelatococcus sp. B33]
MREALARSDFDAVRRSPAPARARRPAASGPRARGRERSAVSGAGAVAGRLAAACLALIGGLLLALVQLAFRALERWPVSVVGGLLATALSAAIIVNAVSQEGPHPSPLFGGQTTAESPATRRDPLPPPRETSGAPAARPAQTAPSAQAPAAQAPAAPAANDPIAQLLTTGTPPAAKPAASNNGAQNNAVLGVQKALVKLGYAITADGLMGPATRQAISDFEKLEGLTVTGDPANAAMRKALSVAAGAALD